MRLASTILLLLVFSGALNAQTADRLLSLLTQQSIAAPCEAPGDEDFPLPIGDSDWMVPLECEELAEQLHFDTEFTPCFFCLSLSELPGRTLLMRDGISPLSSYAAPLLVLQRFLN